MPLPAGPKQNHCTTEPSYHRIEHGPNFAPSLNRTPVTGLLPTPTTVKEP